MQISYQTLAFDALTNQQLYAVLRLRVEVFVVEQTCAFQDLDDRDQDCLHLLGITSDGRLATYSRLLDRDHCYPGYASIGRVVTAPFARGLGLGRPLMLESIRSLHQHFGIQAIKIGAQAHLQPFYNSIGFVGVGASYMEDGILHRGMILPLPI